MDFSLKKNIFQRNDPAAFLVIGALFLLALWLRSSSLDWGLPFRLHPDEWKYVSAGANCHTGEWNPKYFRNPPGFSYLNAAWYPVWLKVRTPVEVPEWLGIDSKWLKPNDRVEATFLYRPFDLVLGGRALSAFFGALTCVAIFFLATNWMSKQYAAGAALLAAVSFANVRESHFAVNDATAACLVVWALVLGMRAYRSGLLRWFYLSAALGGVAAAFKYNMFPAVASAIAYRGLRYWESRDADSPFSAVRDSILMGLLSVFCFLIVCPFPIVDSGTFFAEIHKLKEAAAKPWQGQDVRWAGVQLLETIWISEGAISSILALGGLTAAIKTRRWALSVFPLFYSLLVMTHSLYFVRFSLPLLPWISLSAAFAIYCLAENMPSAKSIRYGMAAAIFIFAAVDPLIKDVRSNHLLKQTDTRVQFVRWLRTEYSEPSLVAVDQFSLPLVYRGVADFWSNPADPRIVYIDRLPSDRLSVLDGLERPVGAIAVSDFVTLPGYVSDTYEERRNALRGYAEKERAEIVFQPFRGEWTPKALDAEDAYSPFRNLWERERPGAVIEVYLRK